MAEVAEDNILGRATRLPVFSLQKYSLLNFSTTILCNNKELISLITKCVLPEELDKKLAIKKEKAYKNVEAKAKELFSKMPEIGKFKDMILDFLWPVTYRIIQWKSVYAPTINELQYVHWTNRGRIDGTRTAKYIIENKAIPIKKRFLLACRLCLSKEIYDIWCDMSDDDRMGLLEEDCENISHLLLFWTNKLQGNDDAYEENLNEALDCATKIASIEAIKYLFSIVPEQEKNDKAVLCSDIILSKLGHFPIFEEEDSDMAYFSFEQMTEKNQKTFFNSNVSVVLLYLLYSPGQKEFINALKYKLEAISKADIEQLLHLIFWKLHLGIYKDYDYRKLFVSVWQKLKEPFKNYLKESWILEFCFCLLISDYFRFILLKRLPKKAKKPSISRHQYKWKLLLFFIENDIVTTESLRNHRTRVSEWLHVRNSNKPAWRRLMKFVRDKKNKQKRK